MTECRMWNCTEPASDGRFCSDQCRVLFDKRKQEAREAERDAREAEREAADERRVY